MRRVKNKERLAAGNIYCSFCRPEKVDAVFRNLGFADHRTGFACEEHKDKLIQNDYPEEDTSDAMYSISNNMGV